MVARLLTKVLDRPKSAGQKYDLSSPNVGYTLRVARIIIGSGSIKINQDYEVRSMAIEINSQKYYRTSEACQKTGISRATLFRWLKAGLLKKSYRDRRGWRLFTEDDLAEIRAEANRVETQDTSFRR
jgi:excisionase family DNA binding protein